MYMMCIIYIYIYILYIYMLFLYVCIIYIYIYIYPYYCITVGKYYAHILPTSPYELNFFERNRANFCLVHDLTCYHNYLYLYS